MARFSWSALRAYFCATLSDLWRASAATDSMTMPDSDAEDLDTTAEAHAADDWRYA